jgi:predicted nucleic acid-binding protein
MGKIPLKRVKRPVTKRSTTKTLGTSSQTKLRVPIAKSLNVLPPGLSDLRQFLEVQKQFAALAGQLVTFQVVVDANILIRELLWMATARENETAKPALLECLEAKTIVAHVTPRIVEEVERTMKDLAANRGLPDKVWKLHWSAYLSMLIVVEPDSSVTSKYETDRDPTDAPTLALAETHGIDGIMSSDADIKAMGGNVLPLSFKLEARDYSRKAAIQVSLKIGGTYIAVGAVEGLILVAKSLGAAVQRVRRLSGWMKVLLAVGSICLVAHPTARKAIQNSLASSGRAVAEATPELFSLVASLYQEYEQVRAKPPTVRYT